MNIQIFGKSKCFDTKKAEGYSKERGVKFQAIDLSQKGMSKKEFESVLRNFDSIHALIDEKSKAYEQLYIKYLANDGAVLEKLMENPVLFKTPIVRNGAKATIGYQPDIWKTWA